MQIQVFIGHPDNNKTRPLQVIQNELKCRGIDVAIHRGSSCTTPFFINQICHMATSGATHFLADDCTQFQIKAVLELNAKGIHSGVPSDFMVHLVRQA